MLRSSMRNWRPGQPHLGLMAPNQMSYNLDGETRRVPNRGEAKYPPPASGITGVGLNLSFVVITVTLQLLCTPLEYVAGQDRQTLNGQPDRSTGPASSIAGRVHQPVSRIDRFGCGDMICRY
jgi:hypothetical protein